MTARETLTPDGVEVVIGEARAHVERDAWLSRGTRRTLGVLLAEIDRLRALPVLPTCGECPAHAEVGDDGPNGADGIGYVCGHHEDLRATGPGDTPPSWCPLRGER